VNAQREIEWFDKMADGLTQGQASRRMMLVYFAKEPCANCEALNRDSLSDETVQRFIADHLVPTKILLNDREERHHFRDYRVVWTPTLVLMDWRGRDHYRSVGYLPRDEFWGMLHVGVARSLMPWSRYDEATALLNTVVAQPANRFAPEALYWRGIAQFLGTRRHTLLDEAWATLKATYPDSVWAARVPPPTAT